MRGTSPRATVALGFIPNKEIMRLSLHSSVGVHPQQRNNAVVVARRSNLSAEKGEKF